MGTFLMIAVASASFFLLALMADFDHDLDFGGDHGGGLESGHDHSGAFSVRSLLLFGTGFGAAGMIATANGLSTSWASAIGVGVGVFVAKVGLTLTRMMVAQEGDSTPSVLRFLGCTGIVTHTIPENGMGQVRVKTPSGGAMYVTARAARTIREGAIVEVRATDGSEVRVVELDPVN